MPIYEYICERCGHEFEKLVYSWSAAPSCDRCESGDVRRLPSLFGIGGASRGGAQAGGGGSSCGSCHASSCKGCSSGGRRRAG